MVETIVPVVHGTRTWMLSLALFTAGAVATAGLLGLALGAALPAGGAAVAAAVAVFALLEAAAELGLVRLPLPQMRRQVPERWRERYPQPLTALLYGAGLGFGFATYLPVATLPVVAVGVAALVGTCVRRRRAGRLRPGAGCGAGRGHRPRAQPRAGHRQDRVDGEAGRPPPAAARERGRAGAAGLGAGDGSRLRRRPGLRQDQPRHATGGGSFGRHRRAGVRPDQPGRIADRRRPLQRRVHRPARHDPGCRAVPASWSTPARPSRSSTTPP